MIALNFILKTIRQLNKVYHSRQTKLLVGQYKSKDLNGELFVGIIDTEEPNKTETCLKIIFDKEFTQQQLYDLNKNFMLLDWKRKKNIWVFKTKDTNKIRECINFLENVWGFVIDKKYEDEAISIIVSKKI